MPARISVFAVINTLAHSKREAPVFWKTNRLRKSFIDPFFLSSSLHPFPTQNWLCCHTAMTSRMAPLQRKQMKAYWFYSMQWHLRHNRAPGLRLIGQIHWKMPNLIYFFTIKLCRRGTDRKHLEVFNKVTWQTIFLQQMLGRGQQLCSSLFIF